MNCTCWSQVQPVSMCHWHLGLFVYVVGFTSSFTSTAFLRQRSEGCALAMEGTGADDSHWIRQVCSAKQHGSWPAVGFGRLSTSSKTKTQVKKRSLLRAYERASKLGFTWYKGQQIVAPADFCPRPASSFKPPSIAPSQPVEHKPRNRLVAVHWNADGLSRHKYEDALTWLHQQRVDCAVLTETHWSYHSTWRHEHWHILHDGCSSDLSNGIMILISKRLCNESQIAWASVITGRLIHCRIHLPHRPLDIVAVYQYVDSGTKAQFDRRKQVWTTLHELLGKLPKRNLLLMCGDFNCSLPSTPRLVQFGHFMHSHCKQTGKQHKDMGLFAQALLDHHIVALNSWTSEHGPTLCSWDGPGSRIDFVCTRLHYADTMAKDVIQLPEAPFVASSGIHYHIPLLCSIACEKRFQTRPTSSALTFHVKEQCKMAYHMQTPQWGSCVDDLRKSLKHPASETDPLPWIHQMLNQGALQHFGRAPPTSEFDSQQLTMNKWHHRRKYLHPHRATLQTIFSAWHHFSRFHALDKVHRKFAATRRRMKVEKFLAEAEVAHKYQDPFLLHKVIAKHTPMQSRQRVHLRGESGNFLTPIEETAAYCNHIALTWQGHPIVLPAGRAPGVPFTLDELIFAIERIPAMKSVAPPFAPAMFYKIFAQEIASLLFPCLTVWWNMPIPWVPQSWRDGWACFLPKRGKNCTKVSNLRILALQEPVGKAVLRMITRKARDQCLPTLCEIPQFAYMPGRGTINAVLRVESHCRAVRGLLQTQSCNATDRHFGKPRLAHCSGIQIFLDLQKAFDKIPRRLLVEALELLPIDHALVTLLLHWHADTHYYVSVNGESKAIPVFSGVRQGCCAAPFLWCAVMHLFFHRCAQVIPREWLLAHLTIYADDIHLACICCNDAEFQQFVNYTGLMFDCIRELGLQINDAKSNVIWTGTGTQYKKHRAKFLKQSRSSTLFVLPTSTGSRLIPLVTKTLYLGTRISYGPFEEQHAQMRLMTAWRNFNKLRCWLIGKKGASFQLRRRIWQTCILPVATYGIFAIGLTPTSLHCLTIGLTKMLRKMFNNQAHVTHMTDAAFFQYYGLPSPQQLLWRLGSRMLLKYQSALWQLAPQDIVHYCDLTAWQATIHLLATSIQAPDPRRADLTSRPQHDPVIHFRCSQCCAIFATDTELHRHLHKVHGQRRPWVFQFDCTRDTLGGLPTCKHCGVQFADWRPLKNHINLGRCPHFTEDDNIPMHDGDLLLTNNGRTCPQTGMNETAVNMPQKDIFVHSISVQVSHHPEVQAPPDDLDMHRSAALNPNASAMDAATVAGLQQRFQALVFENDFDSIGADQELCQYLKYHCHACGRTYGRVQDLNAHIRNDHAAHSHGTIATGIQWSAKLVTQSPCRFCQTTFTKSHVCPICIQMAFCSMMHEAPGTTSAQHRCHICQADHASPALLASHLREVHHLKPYDWNEMRDVIPNTTVCAHCGSVGKSLNAIRNHISFGYCSNFDPSKDLQTAPIDFVTVAIQTGDFAALFQDDAKKQTLMLQCSICQKAFSSSCSGGAAARNLGTHHSRVHGPLKSQALQLCQLLDLVFHSKHGCVCSPPVVCDKLEHVCLAYQQLAMAHLMILPHEPLIPVVMTQPLVHNLLAHCPAGLLARVGEAVLSRHFDFFWKDGTTLAWLRSTCICCGLTLSPAGIRAHLQNYHQLDHDVVQAFLQMFVQTLSPLVHNDGCALCGMVAPLPQANWAHLFTCCVPTQLACAFPIALDLLNGDRSRGHSRAAHGSISAHATSRKRSRQQTAKNIAEQQDRDQTTGQRLKLGPCPKAPHGDGHQARQRPGCLTLPDLFHRVRGHPERRYTPEYPGGIQAMASEQTTGKDHRSTSDASPTWLVADTDDTSGSAWQSQPNGRVMDPVNPEQTDSPRRLLAIPDVESKSQSFGDQRGQEGHLDARHGISLAAAPTTPLPRQCHPLSRDEIGQAGPPSHPVETGAECSNGCFSSGSAPTVPQCGLAAGMLPSPAQRIAAEQVGRRTPEDSEAPMMMVANSAAIMAQIMTDGPQQMASWVLANLDATQCYVNAPFVSTTWALLQRCQYHVDDLGCQSNAFHELLCRGTGAPINLCHTSCLVNLFSCWFRGSGQQDVSEFCQHIFTWLDSPVINMSWETRFLPNAASDAATVHEKGDKTAPIHLDLSLLPPTQLSVSLSDILGKWHCYANMMTGLCAESQIVCIHMARFLNMQLRDNHRITVDQDCTLHVFLDALLTTSMVTYCVMAMVAYSGDSRSGHYCAMIKVLDPTTSRGHHWQLHDDNKAPIQIEVVPQWFQEQVTHFWLVKKDLLPTHSVQGPSIAIAVAPNGRCEQQLDPLTQLLQLFQSQQ